RGATPVAPAGVPRADGARPRVVGRAPGHPRGTPGGAAETPGGTGADGRGGRAPPAGHGRHPRTPLTCGGTPCGHAWAGQIWPSRVRRLMSSFAPLITAERPADVAQLVERNL